MTDGRSPSPPIVVRDASSDAARADAHSQWAPLNATALYESRSLEQWAIDFAQWTYAETSCDDPALDEDGSLCALYMNADNPVFFLAPGTALVRTKCTVPRGKAILVPVALLQLDNAGVPSDQWLTDDEMTTEVDGFVKSIQDAVVRFDGVDAPALDAYRVGPVRFAYDLPPEPNWYSCNQYQIAVTGRVDPSFFGGLFVLFPPPPPGTHTLEYSATAVDLGQPYVSSVKTTFVVE